MKQSTGMLWTVALMKQNVTLIRVLSIGATQIDAKLMLEIVCSSKNPMDVNAGASLVLLRGKVPMSKSFGCEPTEGPYSEETDASSNSKTHHRRRQIRQPNNRMHQNRQELLKKTYQ